MKYVILRDDDISFFTRVDWLKRLYEPLLERGLPFSLSVIPQIRGDISDPRPENVYWKLFQYQFEPFIPPAFRGRSELYPVSENYPLVDFLKQYPQIEVVQHGYAHEVLNGAREFGISSSGEMDHRVSLGKRLLEEALGQEPRFFVPPWDTLSLQATRVLRHHFSGVTLSAYSHRILPRHLALKFFFKKWLHRHYLFWGEFLLLEHPATYLGRFNDPAKMIEQVLYDLEMHSLLILVNHHWEYFFDWNDEPCPEFFSAWQRILQELLSKEDVQIMSFSELYLVLRRRRIEGSQLLVHRAKDSLDQVGS